MLRCVFELVGRNRRGLHVCEVKAAASPPQVPVGSTRSCLLVVPGCDMPAGSTEHKNSTNGTITRLPRASLENTKAGSHYASCVLPFSSRAPYCLQACPFNFPFAVLRCLSGVSINQACQTTFKCLKTLDQISASPGDGDVLFCILR